jgi:protein-tyrosine phosphatase
MVKVLFVCLGNICRSPTAQGVFQRLAAKQGLADQVQVDSAGTSSYHVGDAPCRRMQNVAHRRGIDLSWQRSRQVTPSDCERFDYLVAMDRANLRDMQWLCPDGQQRKVSLLLDYAPHLGISDVPDPYYSTGEAERAFDLIEEAAAALLEQIKRQKLGS